MSWAPPANGSAPPPVASASVLLRIRHIFASGEEPGSGWGSSVTVDLAALLAPSLTVTGGVELTADASRPLAAARASQIQWAQLPPPQVAAGGDAAATRASKVGAAAAAAAPRERGLVVTLEPMDLRTFLLELA